MRDGEISDVARAVITPLLPPGGRARGRWRDPRQVLEGCERFRHCGAVEPPPGGGSTAVVGRASSYAWALITPPLLSTM